ncbi:uncharacterized protein LOC117335704 isoform X2 [Pecten maximus]|nr:uncharacterized protein LOC117335704 isoform X2 [Pecten maximus]
MATEAGSLTNTPMLEQVFVNPDHSSQVLYQLSELWRDKKLCDATIEVGPVKVYVHRLVLLAACPYLLTVGGQHEVSILEVKLPMTVGLEGLNVFLTYLYDGVLHLTSANLRSVEKLTKILKVTSIQKFCQEFRDSNKETGTADKLATDYSLKMTNSSLQIIFSEIQNEMKRESTEPEAETPSKRPRMNLDKLSAALQKKSSQSDSVKDNGRGHSVIGMSSSGPSEGQQDDRTSDPLMMQVKEEPVSDYEDEDDTSFSEDTSESIGYSGTTDFVRQAPYDTRPFPNESSATSGNKLTVAIPPPPSLQKRPSLKHRSFPPSAQHLSQTSETASDAPSEDANSGDLGASDETGVDATKVLKNIVKSMPEMAMNLGTASEIGEDNKPRSREQNHPGSSQVEPAKSRRQSGRFRKSVVLYGMSTNQQKKTQKGDKFDSVKSRYKGKKLQNSTLCKRFSRRHPLNASSNHWNTFQSIVSMSNQIVQGDVESEYASEDSDNGTSDKLAVLDEVPMRQSHINWYILDDNLSMKLVKWVINSTRIGYKVTYKDIRYTCKALLDEAGKKLDFLKNNFPSAVWSQKFRRRNPVINKCLEIQPLQNKCKISAKHVGQWFQGFSEYLSEEVLNDENLLTDPSRWYMLDIGAPLVGCKNNAFFSVIIGSRTEFFSYRKKFMKGIPTIVCMCADGHYPKPMVILRDLINSKQFMTKHTVLGLSRCDWFDSRLFYAWLEDTFIPDLGRRGISSPVVLLIDGHSHILSYPVCRLCKDNGIILYCMTKWEKSKQPCHSELFPLLATEVIAGLQEKGKKLSIHKSELLTIFDRAWHRTKKSNAKIAMETFRDMGIFPFDPRTGMSRFENASVSFSPLDMENAGLPCPEVVIENLEAVPDANDNLESSHSFISTTEVTDSSADMPNLWNTSNNISPMDTADAGKACPEVDTENLEEDVSDADDNWETSHSTMDATEVDDSLNVETLVYPDTLESKALLLSSKATQDTGTVTSCLNNPTRGMLEAVDVRTLKKLPSVDFLPQSNTEMPPGVTLELINPKRIKLEVIHKADVQAKQDDPAKPKDPTDSDQEHDIGDFTEISADNLKKPNSPTDFSDKTCLTDEDFEEVLTWMADMERRGFMVSKSAICLAGKLLLEKFKRENPFHNNLPKSSWFYDAFKSKFPEVFPLPKPQTHSVFSRCEMQQWFEDFEVFLATNSTDENLMKDPSRWYMVDVAGILYQAKKRQIFSSTKERQLEFKTRFKGVAILACMCADGCYPAPMQVLANNLSKRQHMIQHTSLGFSPTCWIDFELFLSWLHGTFIPDLNARNVQRPVVVLINDLSLFLSLQTSYDCEENGILLYCKPKLTLMKQPFQIEFLPHLEAKILNVLITDKRKSFCNLSSDDIVEALDVAWGQISNGDEKMAVSAFEWMGIFPLNKENGLSWFDKHLVDKHPIRMELPAMSKNNVRSGGIKFKKSTFQKKVKFPLMQKSSLFRKRCIQKGNPTRSKSNMSKVINTEQENKIIGWVEGMAKKGIAIGRKVIKMCMKTMLTETDDVNVSVWWNELQHQCPIWTRLVNESEELGMAKWFENFANYLNEIFKDVILLTDPSRLYILNMAHCSAYCRDQKLFTKVQSNCVRAFSNVKARGINIITCMCADGHYPDPMVVMKCVNGYKPSMAVHVVLCLASLGMIDHIVFMAWIEDVFVPDLDRRGVSRPVVLFVEKVAKSFLTYQTCRLCEENGILLYFQDFDAYVEKHIHSELFDLLSIKWFQELQDHFEKFQIIKTVNNLHNKTFLKIFDKAWGQTVKDSKEFAMKAFREFGIYPLDKAACESKRRTSPMVDVSPVTTGNPLDKAACVSKMRASPMVDVSPVTTGNPLDKAACVSKMRASPMVDVSPVTTGNPLDKAVCVSKMRASPMVDVSPVTAGNPLDKAACVSKMRASPMVDVSPVTAGNPLDKAACVSKMRASPMVDVSPVTTGKSNHKGNAASVNARFLIDLSKHHTMPEEKTLKCFVSLENLDEAAVQRGFRLVPGNSEDSTKKIWKRTTSSEEILPRSQHFLKWTTGCAKPSNSTNTPSSLKIKSQRKLQTNPKQCVNGSSLKLKHLEASCSETEQFLNMPTSQVNSSLVPLPSTSFPLPGTGAIYTQDVIEKARDYMDKIVSSMHAGGSYNITHKMAGNSVKDLKENNMAGKSDVSEERVSSTSNVLSERVNRPGLNTPDSMDTPHMALDSKESENTQDDIVLIDALDSKESENTQDDIVLIDALDSKESENTQDDIVLIDALDSKESENTQDDIVLIDALDSKESENTQDDIVLIDALDSKESENTQDDIVLIDALDSKESENTQDDIVLIDALDSKESENTQDDIVLIDALDSKESENTQDDIALIDNRNIITYDVKGDSEEEFEERVMYPSNFKTVNEKTVSSTSKGYVLPEEVSSTLKGYVLPEEGREPVRQREISPIAD